jgi:hypothetical protein
MSNKILIRLPTITETAFIAKSLSLEVSNHQVSHVAIFQYKINIQSTDDATIFTNNFRSLENF